LLWLNLRAGRRHVAVAQEHHARQSDLTEHPTVRTHQLLEELRRQLTRDTLRDLTIRFVENRTSRDFIIADYPAVMLNRFAFESLGTGFGVASSGLIFVAVKRIDALFDIERGING
jgi:hypothetical protein